MSFLNEKLVLLRELLEISRRQTGLLRAGDDLDIAGPLQLSLEQQESIRTAIDDLDAAHQAEDADAALQAEVRGVLMDIQACDQENHKLLLAAMQKANTDMTRVRGARKQAAAYGDPPLSPGQMFDIKQ